TRPHPGDLVGAARLAQVQLSLDQQVFTVDRLKVGRVDDDRAVHAVADVLQHGRGRTVVHPGTGFLRAEPVGEALARIDRAHRLVRGETAGVEVDAVAHRAVVDEGHGEHVADLAAQHRAGDVAAERPHALPHPGGDLQLGFGDPDLHFVFGAVRRG